MKIQDLRVGNWINLHKNGKQEPYQISSGFDLYKLDESDCSDISPIKLTDEWFYKFGLKKDQNKRFVTTNWTGLCFEYNTQWACYRYTQIGIIEITYGFEYVHELQNLYAVLNKDELSVSKI